MCIALLSTAHAAYSLVLIDNRDEYLNRPTASVDWWPKQHPFVLSGRDLLRPEQGTWLGITKAGRIAVLTNFREDVTPPPSAISRGAIMKSFLMEEDEDVEGGTREWVRFMVDSGMGNNVGGFSLVCGRLAAGTGKMEEKGLAVFSNRVKVEDDVQWILGEAAKSQTVGLSNAKFGDSGWKKVEDGERLLDEALKQSQDARESEDELIQRLLGILSTDTLPRQSEHDAGLETYLNQLRHTILVPPIGRKDITDLPPDEIAAAKKDGKAQIQSQLGISGLYGTQKQSVVLVNREGKVRFFERSLFDDAADRKPIGQGDRDFSFRICGF